MISETDTFARPYAGAIFELAKACNTFDLWENYLDLLSQIVSDSHVIPLLDNPTIDSQRLLKFFMAVTENSLNDLGKNLLKVLSHHKRLKLLPKIKSLFLRMREEYQGFLSGTCSSAVILSDPQKQDLNTELNRYFGKKLQISYQIDPSLIGGFLIKVGDKVVDTSVKSQLMKLREIMVGGSYAQSG